MNVIICKRGGVILKELGMNAPVPESGEKIEYEGKFYWVAWRTWDLDRNEIRVYCDD